MSGYVWTGRYLFNLVPRVLPYPPYGAGRREPWERGCYLFAQSFGKQRASVHSYKCMLIQKHSSLRTNLSKCGEQS